VLQFPELADVLQSAYRAEKPRAAQGHPASWLHPLRAKVGDLLLLFHELDRVAVAGALGTFALALLLLPQLLPALALEEEQSLHVQQRNHQVLFPPLQLRLLQKVGAVVPLA
jgi:hypothetical protein